MFVISFRSRQVGSKNQQPIEEVYVHREAWETKLGTTSQKTAEGAPVGRAPQTSCSHSFIQQGCADAERTPEMERLCVLLCGRPCLHTHRSSKETETQVGREAGGVLGAERMKGCRRELWRHWTWALKVRSEICHSSVSGNILRHGNGMKRTSRRTN